MQRFTLRFSVTFLISLVLVFSAAGSVFAAPVLQSELNARQSEPYAVANGAINVRGGPGVGFWILGYLTLGETVPISGVSADGEWWHVDTRFGPGWVADMSVQVYNTTTVLVDDPGLIGSVVTGLLNVRSGAGSNALSIGRLSHGEQVFILAQSADGNWLQVKWAYGTGWVAKAYVVTNGFAGEIDGADEIPLTSELPWGVVTATFLNVRSGPGINYTVVGYVYGGEELSIMGRSADNAWYQVETRHGTGWVSSSFIASRNEYGGTPITSGDLLNAAVSGPVGIVNTGAAHVRTGPGPQYTSVGVLNGGAQGQVLGRNADWTWLLMDTDLGIGWVYAPLVVTRGEVGAVPYVEPDTIATGALAGSGLTDGQGGFDSGETEDQTTVAPQPVVSLPVAVVTTGALNIRSGPNAAFSVLGSVYGGATLTIIGQSTDRGWWLVESEYGDGWISKAYVVIRGNASNVPVVK